MPGPLGPKEALQALLQIRPNSEPAKDENNSGPGASIPGPLDLRLLVLGPTLARPRSRP